MSNTNPYQAPQSRVDDVAEQAQTFVLAERATRLGAASLDGIIFMIPVLVAVLPLVLMLMNQQGMQGIPIAPWMNWLIGIASIIILAVLITNLIFWHRYSQSIGKRILKIKIVRADGSRAGLRRIFFLRLMVPGLIGAIPFAGNVFSVVDVLMIFRDSRKCLHDNIADTLVIKA